MIGLYSSVIGSLFYSSLRCQNIGKSKGRSRHRRCHQDSNRYRFNSKFHHCHPLLLKVFRVRNIKTPPGLRRIAKVQEGILSGTRRGYQKLRIPCLRLSLKGMGIRSKFPAALHNSRCHRRERGLVQTRGGFAHFQESPWSS